jgi:hypothetical protein
MAREATSLRSAQAIDRADTVGVPARRGHEKTTPGKALRAVPIHGTALNKGWGGEKKAKSRFVLLMTTLGCGSEPALNEP